MISVAETGRIFLLVFMRSSVSSLVASAVINKLRSNSTKVLPLFLAFNDVENVEISYQILGAECPRIIL